MNLRIAPEYLRFRISEAEFALLQSGETLQSFTHIAEGVYLSYTILNDKTTIRHSDCLLNLETVQNKEATHLNLSVCPEGIEQLISGKDGIRAFIAFANGEMLTVGLEVDIHSIKGTSKS